jgi:hypothetical protein
MDGRYQGNAGAVTEARIHLSELHIALKWIPARSIPE